MYSGVMRERITDTPKMDNKGIKIVRRETTKLTKDILKQTLETLHYEKNTTKAITDIKEYTRDILEGKMQFEKFIMNKKLGSEYKNPTIPHAYLANKINERAGIEVYTPGDRVDYVFVKNLVFKNSTQQYHRVEDPKYVQDNKMTLDYRYYIDKQIANAMTDCTQFIESDLKGFFKDIAIGGNGKMKQLTINDFFT